jgi:hypothetical protein
LDDEAAMKPISYIGTKPKLKAPEEKKQHRDFDQTAGTMQNLRFELNQGKVQGISKNVNQQKDYERSRA